MTKRVRPPRLTIRALRPLVAGLRERGVAVGPLLAAAGISRERLSDPDATLSGTFIAAFWAQALAATGDDFLGLHLAEAAPMESFEVHGYALMASRSLRDAYRRACRYQRLIHESTTLELHEEGEHGTLRHALPGGRPVGRHPADFLVTAWVRFGRRVTGTDWSPSAVFLAHDPPRDTAEYLRALGVQPRFRAGMNAIRIEREALDLPGVAGDDQLAEIFDRHVSTLLPTGSRRPALSDRVRAILAEGLHQGDLSAAYVARRLSMSDRTVRRGLKAEHTGHRKLLDQLRHERAMELLSGRTCSIGEVAFLLGFSELSAFHRAFKRWTGMTPAQARRRDSGRLGQ